MTLSSLANHCFWLWHFRALILLLLFTIAFASFCEVLISYVGDNSNDEIKGIMVVVST